ncbi:TIGR03087 family PEP-CTERM/XrtA system glycosyltransferase [bacterium]|nr:TIGR03087 family PEP-CTERM/XrtA system glycosyltransferase [bacterium]
MNILFLSPRVPDPPNKGDKIRSHHLMRRIAARHDVHVACLLDEPADREHVESVREWASSVTFADRRAMESAWRGATGALGGRPLSVGWFRSGELVAQLAAKMGREAFDVAVAYCTSMTAYLDGFDGPRVLDLVDVDSEKWRQYAERSALAKKAVFALECRLLRGWEQRLVREYERSVVVSAREREVLAGFADAERVEVVTNGVDTEFWSAGAPRERRRELVFVGALDYFANEDGIVDFARRVMPRVRERCGDVELRIVGRQPGPAVTALGELDGVTVVGEVDDVRPELARASVAVTPLRIAQGLQNKVLEAMAAGVPVASSESAIRGIDGTHGEHFLVAETADEWAAAVGTLLDDTGARDVQVERAKALVRDEYSWDRKALEYEAVLAAAVERHAARREGRAA